MDGSKMFLGKCKRTEICSLGSSKQAFVIVKFANNSSIRKYFERSEGAN